MEMEVQEVEQQSFSMEEWICALAKEFRRSVYMIPTSRGGLMVLPRHSGAFKLYEYYQVLASLTGVLKDDENIWFRRIPNKDLTQPDCLALNTNGEFSIVFSEEQKELLKERA